MRQSFKTAASMGLALALLAAPVGAITINDDAGEATAQALGAPFTSVVNVGGFCSGAIIAPTVVLTAYHCGTSAGDFDGVTVAATEGDGTEIESLLVASVTPFAPPFDTLLDGEDLILLHMSTAFSLTPMRFAPTLSIGQEVLMVGYGLNGLGSTGHEGTADGQRWAAENVVDFIGAINEGSGVPGNDNMIATDFDDPTGTTNTLGFAGSSPFALPNEGSTAPGDSGGPLLVNQRGEWLIAGALSGGTTGTSEFGDISFWTGTFDPTIRSFIEGAGGQYAAPIPLPAGVWLLFAGLGVLAMARRRAAA